ncbi:MAG: hypothetical protein AAF399_15440 [Bacteroidota bacterium]
MPDSETDSSYPTQFQKRIVWSGLAALSAVLIGAIVVGLIYLFGLILAHLQPILVPVAVAAILAYLLEPLIELLRKHQGWGRLKSFYIVYIGTVLLGFVLAFLVIYPAMREGRQFVREYLTPLPQSELNVYEQQGLISPLDEGEERPWLGRTKLGFNSSLEVRIDVAYENLQTGEQHPSNTAYYTFVAVDQSGRPIPVNAVDPETEKEKEWYESALQRRELRLLLAGRITPSEATGLKEILESR